jgi:hypothetical protein
MDAFPCENHVLCVQRQNVSGQNVSATKRSDPKCIGTKRIAHKTYRLQNVSETKRIGGQNVSADKTYRRTECFGYKTFWQILKFLKYLKTIFIILKVEMSFFSDTTNR